MRTDHFTPAITPLWLAFALVFSAGLAAIVVLAFPSCRPVAGDSVDVHAEQAALDPEPVVVPDPNDDLGVCVDPFGLYDPLPAEYVVLTRTERDDFLHIAVLLLCDAEFDRQIQHIEESAW